MVGETIVEALAAAVEAARRSLAFEAYDGQIKAALVMLDCRLAEMATGEGKTSRRRWRRPSARWPGCRCMCSPPTIIWWSGTPASWRRCMPASGCGWLS
jgi:hypothetical protein